MATPLPTPAFIVDGTVVELPVHIPEAVAGAGIFTARADRLAADLPDGLQPVRLPTGQGLVAVMAVEYVENPLGDYDEMVVGTVATPTGDGGVLGSLRDLARGRVGLWVRHMPVSQAYTREAGETIWGYPKTLDELVIHRAAGQPLTGRWAADGRDVLTLTVTTRGVGLRTPSVPASTYTTKEGVVHRTVLSAAFSGFRAGPLGARLELGDHPIAEDLRALGVGRRAIVSARVDAAEMTFQAAQALRP